MAMISIGLHHPVCLFPALSKRKCHTHISHVPNEGFRSAAAGFTAHTACVASHSYSSQHRSRGRCQAIEQDVGGYTPASFITFSEDPTRQCHHHAEVVVDAPIDACFQMWSDWHKLIEFLDLIGQIGLDNNSPDMALFQCFYRWRKMPIMEIVFLLERLHVEVNKRIAFESVYGMPLAGTVDLQEQADGQTKVKLYFSHPVPNLLVQMQVGPFGMETHMKQILKENLATYKGLVEAAAPSDWQQQKQQVAANVQQQEQSRQQAQQQQQQELPRQAAVQQQQQEEVQQRAAPAVRKQRTSRRTAAAVSSEEPSPPPAAASKARSRSVTSRRTGSFAAAEAAVTSNSSIAGRRRSRAATAAAAAADANNGAGQQQAKPRRSSTSRRTASAREQ